MTTESLAPRFGPKSVPRNFSLQKTVNLLYKIYNMKTVIVTGASGNMGQAVVKKFLAEGFTVIGTSDPNEKGKTGVEHSRFEQIVVDLKHEEDTHEFVADILARYPHIDAAVLTVGGFAMGNIKNTKTSDIAQQYQLNFETAYNIAKPVFAQMMEQKNGRIFMVGSRPGLAVATGKAMVGYSLAKSLVFRLAEIMNEEAKGTNVVTSVIVPSTIDTAPNRSSMPDADFDSWVKPEAIANVIHFYCTEDAAALREPVIKIYNNA
jgi:NAD(P)-dependent dehydrogenase (short-subunit alcohol dehydrogenase family)